MKDVACSGWRACGRLGFGRLLLGDMLALGLALGAGNFAAAQTGSGAAPAPAPSAGPAPPAASASAESKPAKPAKPAKPYDTCDIKNAGASMVATGGLRAVSVLGVGETARTAGSTAVGSRVC
ncbi:MAG: hypothetical protein ABR860_15905, partial [Terracidiphilus sp.]